MPGSWNGIWLRLFSMRALIHLHPQDNVAVAARRLAAGETLTTDRGMLRVVEPVPMGHKVALVDLACDSPVVKYGQTIGFAAQPIRAGQWVHCHNVVLRDFDRDPKPCSAVPPPPEPIRDRTFLGYRRPSGRVGTRNYIAVISNVNCSASVAKFIARRFDAEALKPYPAVDGVVAFTHGGGCGMPYRGTAHEMLNRTLAGIARHPNIGGYLLVGLGCEQGALGYLVESQQLIPPEWLRAGADRTNGPIPVLSIQDLGGTTRTVEAGVRAVARLLPQVNEARREPVPASEIVLATECGGSDGNSGISANPALGYAADKLVACGGTVILSETTEIYGAEHLLTRRAVSPEVAQKLLDRIAWWKWYTGIFGAELDNNPSVGNKEGGLTTIVEKSLGAIAKGGTTALVDVYEYAEPVRAKGFVVMDTPGYDPPSVTGMVAGGANVVVFTTGRGSCFGCKPAPSIKVATNTPMFLRMEEDMDINAGTILEGTETVAEVGERIFDEILAVASGKRTKSEVLSIGDEEFVPWLVGPVL
ncbi:MAG: dehydratase [Pirellulaceae bacterium]|nr:MAG: dehydratase [Pirellulaceae bacterium]